MWANVSGNPKNVGLSPASGEKLVVGQSFSRQCYNRFLPLATHLNPTQEIKLGTRLFVDCMHVSNSIVRYTLGGRSGT